VNVGATGRRFDRLDALRGVAIVWMALFHFGFDLNHFGLLQPRQNFYTDPFWTVQRSAIVSLFLFAAGLSQAVAWQAGQGWSRFWRRWVQVAGCAVLVSMGSAIMFPRSWISFGVLHGIAVMLLVCRAAAPMPLRWLLLGGALALLLPLGAQHPLFDSRWTYWLGLVTRKPYTEDYVPVLPWLGVMLWGLAAGRWLLAQHPAALAGAVPAPLRPLAALGRWSLSFYMLHQPVLIGAILVWQAVRAWQA
jgi:uncharacterized membrane protein